LNACDLFDAAAVLFESRTGGIIENVSEVADVALRFELVEVETE